MAQGITAQEIQQFHDDGFIIVRDRLPFEAMQPLINDLEQRIDQLAAEAVEQGILDERKIFADTPFNKRLALLTEATGSEMFWAKLKGKQFKTPGMFALRTYPDLLDMVESIIGPEITAHQQVSLRPKLPGTTGAVGWHQDNAFLDKDGRSTLIVNCWIPLAEASRAHGCLQVIRGSHKFGLLPHSSADDLPPGERVFCEMQPGDVLLTSGQVWHQSEDNTTDTVRWSVDSRYCRSDLPTGRPNPSFVARSKANPQSVAKSVDDWIQLYIDAGKDIRF
jgi:hypothetical protein